MYKPKSRLYSPMAILLLTDNNDQEMVKIKNRNINAEPYRNLYSFRNRLNIKIGENFNNPKYLIFKKR